jgi:hypothetical protein
LLRAINFDFERIPQTLEKRNNLSHLFVFAILAGARAIDYSENSATVMLADYLQLLS